jgi:hypothetical protein
MFRIAKHTVSFYWRYSSIARGWMSRGFWGGFRGGDQESFLRVLGLELAACAASPSLEIK